MFQNCPYYNKLIQCDSDCNSCAFAYNPKIYPQPPIYKCSCGGEYNYPVIRGLDYVCPFCGKVMKGLGK